MRVEDIRVDSIDPRPGNRGSGGMDSEALQRLAGSIESYGVLQPLIVAPADDGRYQLIAGHRRLAAAALAGHLMVPCSIVGSELSGADPQDIETVSLLENLQRQDLHPLDEADGFARLRELGLTNAAIAGEVGCGPRLVAQRLALTKLTDETRAAWLGHPRMPLGTAVALAQLTPALQADFVKRASKYDDGHRSLGSMQPYEVGGFVSSQSDVLTDAPWPLADALLVKAAGPCTSCPKRFGYQRELFDEVEAEGEGAAEAQDARCGDRKCWRGKLAAHVDRARQEAAERGVQLVAIHEGWEAKKNSISASRVERYDAEKHADRKTKPKALLLVDGPEAGSVVDGYVKPAPKEHNYEAEQAKKHEEKQEYLAQRLPILQEVLDRLGENREAQVRALLDERVINALCGHAGRWRPAGMLARLAGVETDDGRIPYDKHEQYEAELQKMPPLERLLVLLAADDCAGFTGVDMLETVRDLLTNERG